MSSYERFAFSKGSRLDFRGQAGQERGEGLKAVDRSAGALSSEEQVKASSKFKNIDMLKASVLGPRVSRDRS